MPQTLLWGQFCPNVVPEMGRRIPAHFSHVACPQRSRTMMWETASYWRLSWHWRHWLEGATHPFIVWTDHKNLAYIQVAKWLNSRQARWALFFTRFDFTISFRPGSKNIKPDALSRQFHPVGVQKHPGPIIPTALIAAPSRGALRQW